MKYSISNYQNGSAGYSFKENKGYSKIYDPFSLGQTEYIYPYAFNKDQEMINLTQKARNTVDQLKENIREIMFIKESPGIFQDTVDFENFGCRIGRVPVMLVEKGEILPTCLADCKELIDNLQKEEMRVLKFTHSPQIKFDKDALDDKAFLDKLEEYTDKIKEDFYLDR